VSRGRDGDGVAGAEIAEVERLVGRGWVISQSELLSRVSSSASVRGALGSSGGGSAEGSGGGCREGDDSVTRDVPNGSAAEVEGV
jgi:hypothetical protein